MASFNAAVCVMIAFLGSLSVLAGETQTVLAPKDIRMTFSYENSDGSITGACEHELMSAISYDWRVVCQVERSRKEYFVHLLWRIHKHTRVPRTAYEILYWLSDVTEPRSTHSGTTVWLAMEEDATPHSLRMSQSVEDDTARLVLEIRPTSR